MIPKKIISIIAKKMVKTAAKTITSVVILIVSLNESQLTFLNSANDSLR